MSGMSPRKGTAISSPLKSASALRCASRVTTHSAPQVEMLSSVTPAPRLCKLAATLLGMASTSALPPMAIMRS